jgi:exopolyphosphatase/guanosine-5'-triphosphate,3'-diphosphate pyrophosphatase
MAEKKYATIDIGSNSILLYIAEKNSDGKFKSVINLSEITRLGNNLHNTGVLNNNAMKKSLEVIKNYKKICDENNVSAIAAVGTMALRTALNSNEFTGQAEKETGIKIEIISGEEEARLSYIALKEGIGIARESLAFDIGGGSTEFIYADSFAIKKRFSVNIGVIKFTESYLKSNPPTNDEILDAETSINKEISSLNLNKNIQILAGMGGTVTNLAAVKHKMLSYNPDIIQGSIITMDELQYQINDFSTKTIEERKNIPGLEPKRADVILAGALIIKSILINSGQNSFTVSDFGIRHGLMFGKFGI